MKDISSNIISIKYNTSLDKSNKCSTCDFNTIYVTNIIIDYKKNNKLEIESEVTTDNSTLITESDLIKWLINNISLDELIDELKLLSEKRLTKKIESNIIVKFNDNCLLNLTVFGSEKDFSRYPKISRGEINNLINGREYITKSEYEDLINELIKENVSEEFLLRVALSLLNKTDDVISVLESYFIEKKDSYYLLELYSIFKRQFNSYKIAKKISGLNKEFIRKIISEPLSKELFYNSHLLSLKEYID